MPPFFVFILFNLDSNLLYCIFAIWKLEKKTKGGVGFI